MQIRKLTIDTDLANQDWLMQAQNHHGAYKYYVHYLNTLRLPSKTKLIALQYVTDTTLDESLRDCMFIQTIVNCRHEALTRHAHKANPYSTHAIAHTQLAPAVQFMHDHEISFDRLAKQCLHEQRQREHSCKRIQERKRRSLQCTPLLKNRRKHKQYAQKTTSTPNMHVAIKARCMARVAQYVYMIICRCIQRTHFRF